MSSCGWSADSTSWGSWSSPWFQGQMYSTRSSSSSWTPFYYSSSSRWSSLCLMVTWCLEGSSRWSIHISLQFSIFNLTFCIKREAIIRTIWITTTIALVFTGLQVTPLQHNLLSQLLYVDWLIDWLLSSPLRIDEYYVRASRVSIRATRLASGDILVRSVICVVLRLLPRLDSPKDEAQRPHPRKASVLSVCQVHVNTSAPESHRYHDELFRRAFRVLVSASSSLLTNLLT